MRNTCKNHRTGKIWFPSKSNSQARGCLSPTAITRLDVFSLLLPLTPSPALYLLPALLCLSPARAEVFPSTWLRAGGGRSRAEPLLSLLQRVMQPLRALRPRTNAAVEPGQPAINTHLGSTGHHTHSTHFRRKSGSQIHS